MESPQSMVGVDTSITCPACGHTAVNTMPRDRCVFFWECPACRDVVRPKPGDCCVYCSYAEDRCPPAREEEACCQGRPVGGL